MAIARISDIKGLVTIGGENDEILKNRDLISEHGGILTIEEFAKIIFDDGREVEVTGPVTFNLDSTFFNENTFEQSITEISDFSSLEYIDNQDISEYENEELINEELINQNDALREIQTEQLDSTLNEINTINNIENEENILDNNIISGQTSSDTANVNPADTDTNEALTLTVTPTTDAFVEDSTTSDTKVADISATDNDGGTITYTLDDNVNYKIVGDEVQLTDAGAAVVNGGGDLPNFTVTAQSTTGQTSSDTANVNPADTDTNEAPDAVDDGNITTSIVTINSSNINNIDSGFSVSALDPDGNSASFSTSSYGFGVSGGSSGADAELGYKAGVGSEKIVVDLDNDVLSVDVSFGWKSSSENAEITFYKDGNEVGSTISYGGSDGIDPTVTLQPDNGSSFDQVVFSASDGGDHDYMINSISFNQVVSDITTDEDTSITIDVLSNDTDVDSDTLSITKIQDQDVSSGQIVNVTLSGTVVGTAQVVSDEIVFTPGSNLQSMNDGESQDISFEYTISDGQGGIDTANVELTVTGSTDNNSPIAVDDTTHTIDISTTTTIFDSSFEDGNADWLTDLDGWSAASGERIESWTGTGSDGNDYIELNTDDTNSFYDASSISRTVSTVDGAEYNLNFDFSARPDYDETVCKFEVLLDGIVVGTYTADGTGLSSVSWQNEALTFTGDGSTKEIIFREAGVNQDNGRGMYLDDIELTQTVTTTQTQAISTDEDSAITVDVLSNDSDSDGGTLSISKIQGQDVSLGQTINVIDTDGSTVIGTAIVVSGEIVFTPGSNLQSMNDGESQAISFEYTVSDGQGGTSNAEVSITVTGSSDFVAIASGDLLFSDDFNDGIEGWSGSNVTNTNDSLQIQSDATATKTFDFGIENAGKEVTITFDASANHEWESGSNYTDYFKVEANESTVINRDSSVDSSYTFNTTIGEDGTLKLDMITDTTADNEYIQIDNLTINASGNDWIQNDDLQSAQLVDGIVEGAYYETSSGVTGYTDENGNFNFRAGDDVTFSVGGVTLGVATAEDISSGQTFLQDIADVDRTDLNDEYLENMAVFLQSIDTADSGDNIVITEAMRNALLNADIDLRTASEDEVQQLIESVGGTYVDENEAMVHVQEMLEEYAGIESEEFEEHKEDVESAVLGNEPQIGVDYQTSSGITGVTSENGTFEYNDGDSITFIKDGEVLSTIDSENIGDDSLITLNELEEFNQEELDLENLELDFDNISTIVDTDGMAVYDDNEIVESDESLENLELSDMLHADDVDMSLSSLLGESEEDISSGNEDTTNKVSDNDDNSEGDYCPFKALEEGSGNLIANIQNDDIVDTNDE